MGTFFVYILKSAFLLAAFYLFYKMLLSKETFHRFNRFSLLGIMVASFILPAVKLQSHIQSAPADTLLDMGNMVVEPLAALKSTPLTDTFHWATLVLLIYGIGVVVFWTKHLFALGNMYRLIHAGHRIVREDDTVLVLHHEDIAPFSWMHYIVISGEDMDENGEIILRHETAHIRHRHSWDLIFADMCISLQWFNPAAWLAKHELQNVHEFEADESVIHQGIDAKRYQLLLIKKAVGTRLYSMANSFNHSSLKKRITMMIKKQSNPWARLKYLYVLPLAAIAVAAFALPEISSELDEISSAKVSDLSAILKTGSPNNVTVKEKEVLVKGQVIDQESGQPLPNATVIIKGTSRGTMTDKDGLFSIPVHPEQVLCISYTGKQNYFVTVEESMPKLITLFMKDEETQLDEVVAVAHPVTQEKPVQPSPKHSVMQNSEVFIVVEQMPEYPGGMGELMKFLGRNLKYPAEAHKNNIQGRVIVQFTVMKDGSIADMNVKRSVHPLLDAEAIRILSTMPKWKPGTQRGEAVNVRYTIPVTFRLSKPQAAKSPDTEMSIRIMSNENNDAIERATAELNAPQQCPIIIIDKRVAGAGYKTELGVNSKDIESVVVIKGENDINKFIINGIPLKLSDTEMQKFKQLYNKEKHNGVIFLQKKK